MQRFFNNKKQRILKKHKKMSNPLPPPPPLPSSTTSNTTTTTTTNNNNNNNTSSSWLDSYKNFFSEPSQPKTVLEYHIQKQNSRRRWGLAIFIIGVIGWIVLLTWALWSNWGVLQEMNKEIPSINNGNIAAEQVIIWAQVLGSRVSGVRLALANTFPVLSKWLGYNNPYTPSIISGMFQMYNMGKFQLVQAMFYLETGLQVTNICQPTSQNCSSAAISDAIGTQVPRLPRDGVCPGGSQNIMPYPPTLWQTVFDLLNRDAEQPCQQGNNSAAAPGFLSQVLPYFNIFCNLAGLILMAG